MFLIVDFLNFAENASVDINLEFDQVQYLKSIKTFYAYQNCVPKIRLSQNSPFFDKTNKVDNNLIAGCYIEKS